MTAQGTTPAVDHAVAAESHQNGFEKLTRDAFPLGDHECRRPAVLGKSLREDDGGLKRVFRLTG
jgi:hypothetical protein